MDLGSNGVRSEAPGEKVSLSEEDVGELPAADAMRYQASVARANYIAQDRSDTQHAKEELARSMSCSARGLRGALVEAGKYLQTHGRLFYFYECHELPKELAIWTDTDYAGC